MSGDRRGSEARWAGTSGPLTEDHVWREFGLVPSALVINTYKTYQCSAYSMARNPICNF